MADANGFVEALKKAARVEREASKPVSVYFGEVVSKTPLKINVEQKMILSEQQLILTRNVTDYMTPVTVRWETEKGILTDGKTTANPAHVHGLAGQKNFLIHNALETGDAVILLRQQAGQKFVVLDRIGGVP
ncbi:MAG: DUF2577 domain-containing protein [Lachnospiraceae bacterium]|nr:DUF2577 domain-containing protein [Lachnospiraceae bacterium]